MDIDEAAIQRELRGWPARWRDDLAQEARLRFHITPDGVVSARKLARRAMVDAWRRWFGRTYQRPETGEMLDIYASESEAIAIDERLDQPIMLRRAARLQSDPRIDRFAAIPPSDRERFMRSMPTFAQHAARLMYRGRTPAQIARQLGIGETTARNYIATVHGHAKRWETA